MKFSILIIIILTGIYSNIRSQKSNEWKLTRYSEGIRIYLKKDNGALFKDVRGTTTIKTSLSALVYLVKTPEQHNKWIYANKTAEIIKMISDFEWIYYNESQAPWPVSNRDLIAHAFLKQDPKTLAVTIESIGTPKYLPEKAGIVRVSKLFSSWVFTPKNDGMIDVKFELSIDLGGNIPSWLVNLSIDKGPYQTLLNMTKLLNETKYKNIKLPYIIDKMD